MLNTNWKYNESLIKLLIKHMIKVNELCLS